MNKHALPPGLADLAEAEQLTDAQVKQLVTMHGTIRGRGPRTLDEWRPLYEAVKKYLKPEQEQ